MQALKRDFSMDAIFLQEAGILHMQIPCGP